MRVIADHSRAATFLISDGVTPSNEGRGYVLRKIIRRAITHGRLLGQTTPFLYEMVSAVRDLMQDAYPELNESANRVSKAVLAEEHRFARTLDVGLGRLRRCSNCRKSRPTILPSTLSQRVIHILTARWVQASSNGCGPAQSWISGVGRLEQPIR